MPLDDRLPLRMDTAADTLLENEIFYRDDIPAFMDRNDCSSPPATPDIRDPQPVGEGLTRVEPISEKDGLIVTSEQALDSQSLLAVLLYSETVRMTASTTRHCEKLLFGKH
jgi:hypothetical protein